MSEYAPQYTFKEKIRIIGLYLIFALPTGWFLIYKFIPWTKTSNWILCHPYGWHIVWYGMGVFTPLFILLIGFLTIGRDMFKIYKFKQYPLPNKKVMNKTKYVYGFRATFICYIFLLWCMGILAFSIYGYFTATKMINLYDPQNLEKHRQKECNVSKM
ncbi:hypothetical protein [Acinetobacter haemolyticus]|uniref:hypothetical protein n=1 Tax=Acinetobacter haemolyticus TaxID=29430 RepID=UPI0021CD558B|nr:hypothetical protein [Acinetobacter haemolyticus]MCU4379294.1 hypothetical protein [Acinetobacter haemolyticus]